jgi:hypothetical protein
VSWTESTHDRKNVKEKRKKGEIAREAKERDRGRDRDTEREREREREREYDSEHTHSPSTSSAKPLGMVPFNSLPFTKRVLCKVVKKTPAIND